MASKKKMDNEEKIVSAHRVAPLADDVPLTLNGKEYRLCLDFWAVREAEEELLRIGIKVDLLRALDFQTLGARSLPEVFFAALHHYQPELTFEDACELVSLESSVAIFEAVSDAYIVAMGVKNKTKNPPKADDPASSEKS